MDGTWRLFQLAYMYARKQERDNQVMKPHSGRYSVTSSSLILYKGLSSAMHTSTELSVSRFVSACKLYRNFSGMPCSDSLVGLFSFFLLCFAIASVQGELRVTVVQRAYTRSCRPSSLCKIGLKVIANRCQGSIIPSFVIDRSSVGIWRLQP